MGRKYERNVLEADVQGLMMPHGEIVAGIRSEAGPSGIAIGVHVFAP